MEGVVYYSRTEVNFLLLDSDKTEITVVGPKRHNLSAETLMEFPVL